MLSYPVREMIFPTEIWMEIFKDIDIPKLMEMRLVCRYFNDVIEEHLNKSQEWKDLVDDTILFECLTLTMQRAYPYDLVTHKNEVDDPVLWRGTYLSYKKWQKVMKYEPTKDVIVPMANFRISCVCTFDKYISIAFENGSIGNYTTDDLSKPFYLAHHKTEIVQIEFWYSNGEVLVVTLGMDKALKFWDLRNKVEISTSGFFASSITFGECRHFCICEMDGILTSYERVDSQIMPGPIVDLHSEDNEVIGHAIDGKHITALSYIEDDDGRCTIMHLYTGKIEYEKLTRFVTDQIKNPVDLPSNLDYSLQRIVMPTITFFFGIGENSIGSTNYYEDEWHEYNLFQRFGCNVRSMALHAQILMFGLEDGSIHLLRIDHYGDVMDLEEKIHYSRRIEVDTVPILDLTVLEVEKKPCIVAITEQRVHLLNFF